jgi:hypothetical protein
MSENINKEEVMASQAPSVESSRSAALGWVDAVVIMVAFIVSMGLGGVLSVMFGVRMPGEAMTTSFDAEVLEAAEGTLAPVACLEEGAPPCDRAPSCKTLPMWVRYDKTVREFFGGITLADLVDGTIEL